jgi:Ser/Thr protein kinase RdoA (MazF antagonist)
MLYAVLQEYGLEASVAGINNISQGLINSTWKINCINEAYILQKVNDTIFKEPENIAFNINSIATYLSKHHPDYFFVSPLKTINNQTLVYKNEGYYRMFKFVQGSHAKNVVNTELQAYEAAMQFGKFSKLLTNFDSSKLKVTLPDFHNLSLRYQQFNIALQTALPERQYEANEQIADIKNYSSIVNEYEQLKQNTEIKIRATHHDTKISNVLFDDNHKGICVIDLDTLMPGYFISDLGDMMRTYLCPASEEETDTSKIEIRETYYKAIVQGYYSQMKNVLTATEKKYFFYAGIFMIYMQALRFLTDFLNNDIYYGAKYPLQNLNRANNQLTLLKRLYEKENELNNILNY